MLRFSLILLAHFIFGVVSVNSQSIFTNPITGTNPNTANPYTTGQTVDPNISVSGIGRGTGAVGTNANNRYNANSWNTAGLDPTAYFEWTLTPDVGCEIDFTSFVYTGQASGTGPTSFSFRSSVDAFASNIGTPNAAGTTINLTAGAYQNITTSITFRFYAWGASGSGGTFSINDFTFNGTTSCGGGGATLNTGAVTGGPFAVDCATDDAGSVAYTGTGTFNPGNTFTVEMSDASGNFTPPIVVGSISSTALSGSIPINIPAGTPTGTGYRFRVVSSNPVVTAADNGTNISINLSGGPCVFIPPYMTSVIINSCDPTCDEGFNEIVFGNSGDYSFDVTASDFNFHYGTSSPGTNYTDVLVNNAGTISSLNTAAGCPGLFVDATGTTIPAGASWLLAYTDICTEALDWTGLCGTGPIYVILQDDTDWNTGGNFANSPGSPGIRHWRTSITTTAGPTFTIDYTTSGDFYSNSDGVYATFDPSGGAASAYGDDDCNLTPVVLPVELIQFEGQKEFEANLLTWSTASERNASYFEVEVTPNGLDWESIGTIAATGFSEETVYYQMQHENPKKSINYYRLNQYDFNGAHVTFTQIVSIDNRYRSEEIIGIFNTLGQEISAETPGIQIHLFEDGSTTKVFKH
jgi:hypothetical protein